MKLEVLNYLKKYIQDKYPMYYNPNDQKSFLNFINVIVSDKKFESELKLRSSDKTVKEVLQIGDMDHVIDDLVNTYAQIKYTKIWANFDALSLRIKDVIIKGSQKDLGIEIISDDILDRICQEIALGIIRSEAEEDYTIYQNGSFNEKYIEDYGYYFREYKNRAFEHVKSVLDKKLEICKFKVTDDTYLLILNGITDNILHNFKYNDVVNGGCDKEILAIFNFCRKSLREEIIKYVDSYITEEIDDLLGVASDEVCDMILSMTIVNGEVSAAKMLDGKLNDIIKGCVVTRRDAIRHIFSVLFGEILIPLSNEKLMQMQLAEKIYNQLRNNDIFNNEIVSGKHDDKIKFLYENEMRVNNSVKSSKDSDKRKRNGRKKKLDKRLLALILAGTLTVSAVGIGIVGTGIYYAWDFGSEIVNDIRYKKQNDAVDKFDSYEYNFIFTKYNESYLGMVLNVTDFYQNASSYDDNFKYLGFYRMYEKVMDDKLAIMDSVLKELKNYSYSKKDLNGFYSSISKYSCYLDFVYDRLVAMGCEQIKDSKYQDAIDFYEKAMMATRATDNTPMDYLIDESPKTVSVIKEIMEMYDDYSQKYQIEFGQLLIDNGIVQAVDGGRKNI